MAEQRIIYDCPECGWAETDHLWTATDLEEKGPPACPLSDQHGQLDMVPTRVVPAVLSPETLSAVGEAIHGYACGCSEPWPVNANVEQMAREALKAAGFSEPSTGGDDG